MVGNEQNTRQHRDLTADQQPVARSQKIALRVDKSDGKRHAGDDRYEHANRGDAELTAHLNGKHVGAAVGMQNDETNPILRPEAG
jgi:hypothetical protein